MGAPRTPPHPDNYMIGKGIVQIAKYTGGVIGAFSDVGNCPRFEYEPTQQEIEHFSSRQANKEQDAAVVIQSGYNIAFTLDEVAVENLRMFLAGSLSGTRIIFANQNVNQLYAIKFTADNTAGPNYNYEFHKVKLTPQGAFSLISDEFTSLSFNGKGLADRAGHATSPFFTATADTTTTTTTTTATTA